MQGFKGGVRFKGKKKRAEREKIIKPKEKEYELLSKISRMQNLKLWCWQIFI